MSARLDVTRESMVNQQPVGNDRLHRCMYVAPALLHLGHWSVLTMGQSVCVADLDGVCLPKGGVGKPFIEELDYEEEW